MGEQTCANPPVIRESTNSSVPDFHAQSNPPANSQANDGNDKPDESVASSGATVRPAGKKRHSSRGGPLFESEIDLYQSNLESDVLSHQVAILLGWKRSYLRATNFA